MLWLQTFAGAPPATVTAFNLCEGEILYGAVTSFWKGYFVQVTTALFNVTLHLMFSFLLPALFSSVDPTSKLPSSASASPRVKAPLGTTTVLFPIHVHQGLMVPSTKTFLAVSLFLARFTSMPAAWSERGRCEVDSTSMLLKMRSETLHNVNLRVSSEPPVKNVNSVMRGRWLLELQSLSSCPSKSLYH